MQILKAFIIGDVEEVKTGKIDTQGNGRLLELRVVESEVL